MKSRGVDSIYSWVVASSCGVIYLMISMPMRLGSIIFVEMIDRYDTNRKDASLPFALAYLMRSISGPFGGFLGEKFGLQQVTMFGCILCSVGIGFCFFSEEIISIDIFLGLIYGSGLGWSTCLVPEIINQHFAKHRAKGFSVVLGLSSVLNFISPLILEKIINDYGVSGSFLIMSAIIFNSVPAAMLLIHPEEMNTSMEHNIKINEPADEKDSSTVEFHDNISNSNLNFAKASSVKKILELIPSDRPSSHSDANQSTSNFEEHDPSVNQSTPISKTKYFEQYEIDMSSGIAIQVKLQDKSVRYLTNKKLTEKNDPDIIESRDKKLTEKNDLDIIESRDKKLTEKNDLDITESRDKKLTEKNDLDIIESRDKKLTEKNDLDIIERRDKKLTEENDLDIFESRDKKLAEENDLDITESRANKLKEEVYLDLTENNKKLTNKIDKDLNETKNKKLNETKYRTINILWNPLFLFITFIQSSHFYVMYMFWTILVDLVRDKNIPRYLEVYFVMAFALLDAVGRSTLGFVTDSGYMTVGNYSALCFGLMGLSCTLLVWVSGFLMTMAAICIFAFISGTNLNVLPGIVTGFIEKEKRTMAMASRSILYAPMSFTMSPLIGYFRGTLGTYNGLLYVMTALCIACSLVLVCLPRLKKHMEKGKEEKSTKL